MPTLQYETRVSPDGFIPLPLPPEFYDRKVVVRLDAEKNESRSLDDDRQVDPARILPNGKTAVDDFLDFCKKLNLPPMTDEEIERAKCDYLMEKYG